MSRIGVRFVVYFALSMAAAGQPTESPTGTEAEASRSGETSTGQPEGSQEAFEADRLHHRDRLEFDIPVGGQVVSLKLERNPRIPASIPIYLGTGEHTYVELDQSSADDFAVYQDAERQASFVLWHSNDVGVGVGVGRSSVRGVFEHDDDVYSVASVDDGGLAMSDDVRIGGDRRVSVGGLTMTLNKVDPTAARDIARAVNDTVAERLRNATDLDADGRLSGGRTKRSFASYEVELFLIIDYSIFRKWERASKRFFYDQREADAIDNIRFYFAHVLNGIDLRYRSIRESDFGISLRPVGMYIAKTSRASYWTEVYPFNEDGVFVEGYRALDALEEWINSAENGLPYFDQVTLFTDHSLFSHYTGGTRHRFYGIADIEGVCGPLRASICRDRGHFSAVQTATHELGHSLGAYHDGSHGCSSADQYIMAVSPGDINESTLRNVLRFSPCSVADFRSFLRRLSDRGDNCLLRRNNSRVDYGYRYVYEKPGQRYSAEEQCKNIYGLYSFYCGGGQNDRSICVAMQCWEPSSARCVTGIEQRAAEGTSCGSRRWCVLGRCKYDARAAYFAADRCIYGDYKGLIAEYGGSYRCSDIKPHRCYEDDKQTMCCRTCDRLRNGPAGCEYGDREPEYCRLEVERRHCYNADIRVKCCRLCGRLERADAPPGCEYGDKQLFCETIQAHNCYQSAETCCATCRQLERNVPGCKYGDRVSWCHYYADKPYMCYDRVVQSTCCAMCRTAARGPPGCEWGDRMPFCSVDDCKSPTRRRHCCRTCSSFSASVGYKTQGCTDKASWCRTMHPSSCYRSGERNTCCSTCLRHHTGPPDCPYGDRFSWCDRSKHCKRSQERSDCCRSCS